jgi:hypothetical protein
MHMNEIVATAFWRRLDTEGHDGCRLIRMKDGWRLSGSTIFDHQGKACMLDYAVDCDAAWRTLSARVHGSVGLDELAFDIERTPDGDWLLDGKVQPAAKGCIDLDLGFTPATNLIAIRRLDPGEEVEIPAPAAYYLEFSLQLGIVEQTYRRTGKDKLHYRSPAYGYDETLTVSKVGFVTDYPTLWTGWVATR